MAEAEEGRGGSCHLRRPLCSEGTPSAAMLELMPRTGPFRSPENAKDSSTADSCSSAELGTPKNSPFSSSLTFSSSSSSGKPPKRCCSCCCSSSSWRRMRGSRGVAEAEEGR